MIVLVEILRVLREVADLHDKFGKSSPSFFRATVDDLAAKPAERVRATMSKAKMLFHMSTEQKETTYEEAYLSARFAPQLLFRSLGGEYRLELLLD